MGFYADNIGEFKKYKIEEFTNKVGLKIKLGSTFSSWSNVMR